MSWKEKKQWSEGGILEHVEGSLQWRCAWDDRVNKVPMDSYQPTAVPWHQFDVRLHPSPSRWFILSALGSLPIQLKIPSDTLPVRTCVLFVVRFTPTPGVVVVWQVLCASTNSSLKMGLSPPSLYPFSFGTMLGTHLVLSGCFLR